jgi:hypothetical protein
MFIMLDLHTNALTACAAPVQQKMPDLGAITFWQIVASRYANNPLVGFDLYNEPHDITDAVWHSGGTVYSSGVSYTAAGMQQLYDAVRGTGATNLVFASGSGWATTYSTLPLTGTTNLVNAVHAYTCPSGTPESGATCSSGPGGVLDPSNLLGHLATAGQTLPVMVTEFGWPSKFQGQYIQNVINYATSHDWTGWDAFAFDGTNQGLFDLVKDTGPVNDPAVSGMSVMANMLNG